MKIEEHDKMIEKLESDKKVQLVNKNFKECKKIKDLIDLKNSKKAKILTEIEEFKIAISDAEENLEKANKTLKIIQKKQV